MKSKLNFCKIRQRNPRFRKYKTSDVFFLLGTYFYIIGYTSGSINKCIIHNCTVGHILIKIID